MTVSIFHVGLTVTDMDRAIDLFRHCFDMEVVHSQVQDNAYSRRLVGESEARFSITQMRFAGGPQPESGHVIELICYETPELPKLTLRNPQPGATHLAFLVPDIRPVYARVLERGGVPLSEPVAITEGVNSGGYACYLNVLDGIVIELLQRPATTTDRRSTAA
ncbi:MULTISPECIES: VOC family protein [Streptomyces]|uniref:VOC family protein n=1 Tax=Streptomyces TaxID=1883 RepID=UPI002F90E6AD|nr:VOC family protein [Streptomyces chartreusis]WTA33503.1 VOC family protein [Streptomyces chartreusis]